MVDKKFILIAFGAVLLAGCSTTRTVQQPPTETKLQMRVVQLENKLEEREKDIEDLRFEIDELSRQVEERSASSTTARIEPIVSSSSTGSPSVTNYLYGDIIRVEASPQDIQSALKNAGYYSGNVDGKLGQNSQKAIRDFQTDHNLQADGVIGRKTWAELKNFLK